MIRGVAPLTALGLLILGSGSLLLLTLTAAEIFQSDDVPKAKIGWTPKLSTTAERLGSATPLTAYQQTTSRPVFFKSRQPFVALPPPPPPPQPPAALPPPPPPPVVDPGLAVGGVMITGGIKKAYLFRKTDRTGSWLAEGEEIMGWKLHSVDSAGAKLQKDSRDLHLPLYAQP